MIKIINIHVPLDYDNKYIENILQKKYGINKTNITNWKIIKRSLDARKSNKHKTPDYILSLSVLLKNEEVYINSNKFKYNDDISNYSPYIYQIPSYKNLKYRPVIIGFGPAGIFSAYILAQAGVNPIVLEQGMDVDSRKKAVDCFLGTGLLNPDCNIQFGEGGAGTFSDGKLNTGIKNPRIKYILETFVKFGAPEEILFTAKPHIGTDILSVVIKNIRNEIIRLGGTIIFNAKFLDYSTSNFTIETIKYQNNGNIFELKTNHLILAIGHSSRDTFRMLIDKKLEITQKNFAIGVRIEHTQEELNQSLYHEFNSFHLPPAEYKLVSHTKTGKALYSFCMCPGGLVVPATSQYNHVVTNGMSYHSRDAINANSALLVGVTPNDIGSNNPLDSISFQEKIEKKAFEIAGNNYCAPISLVGDFLENKISTSFGSIHPSYKLGTKFSDLTKLFPNFIIDTLKLGIQDMSRKIQCFSNSEAILTAPETRSSSPICIKRNSETYQSVSLKGLYPCGEGAGYAGGIVSSAVDGIICAEKILIENV